jgi:hypothetical protein
MAKILEFRLPFPAASCEQKEAELRLALQAERRKWFGKMEADLKRPGHILIAWAISP